MEKTKQTRKGKTRSAGRDEILRAYRKAVLLSGSRPVSVYGFCLELGIKEEEFYSQFGSFEGVERSIWREAVDQAIVRVTKDKAFQEFTAREKVLAFYYTLLEEMEKDRSYFVYQLRTVSKLDIIPGFIRDFKSSYEKFIGSILTGGQDSGEIARRPYLDSRYPQLFWVHFVLILQYWRDDDSPSFEKTDACVEKSVRLAFDLIGKGVLDSAIDFARFVVQSRFK